MHLQRDALKRLAPGHSGPSKRYAVILGSLVLGFLAGAGVLAGSPKWIANPEAGLSDAQREALHSAAHARNDAFLREFVARNGDPRSLPVIEIESYGAIPTSLPAAMSAATLVAEAHVANTTFAPDPRGGMPISTSRLVLDDIVRGTAQREILVIQAGGPVAQADGGALAQLDVDPLLLPGNHVLVLLEPAKDAGTFRTVPGVGILYVETSGLVRVPEGDPLAATFSGLDGVAAKAVLARY